LGEDVVALGRKSFCRFNHIAFGEGQSYAINEALEARIRTGSTLQIEQNGACIAILGVWIGDTRNMCARYPSIGPLVALKDKEEPFRTALMPCRNAYFDL